MHDERHWIRQVRGPAPILRMPHGEPQAGLSCLPAAWQCDLATEELRWSRGVYDLFGIAPGSPVDRRSALELYTPESRSMLDRLRGLALETCGSFTFEAQIQRLDGSLRWMRLNADVQKKDGRAAVLYGTKQDITAEMTARGSRESRAPVPVDGQAGHPFPFRPKAVRSGSDRRSWHRARHRHSHSS